MVEPLNTEYGTDNPAFDRVDDDSVFLATFSEHNARMPTGLLSRIYLNYFILNALTTVASYVIGICPFECTLLAVKHVCKTVTSAATLEIESSSSAACMTADTIAVTVQDATITSTVADALFAQGDIITAKIATGGGDIDHLAMMLVLQPIY
ncbi:hypothetical protein CMI37_05260 [Candidatus Pacearchaeota archaeon]|nr:hypothetical protein [Candidatus Pacearchaeota archaeon]|tara:strand:- start:3017 stop:3472 length:456 start_codon:yes stop_codon:yes gene_type:complete